MTSTSVEQAAVKWGTLTNYAKLLVRMCLGVVTFRILYAYLPADEFGWYQLLWGLLGYLVLMDGGMGFAVQRAAAQATDAPGREILQRTLATVTWSFAILAAGVALLVLSCGDWLFAWLQRGIVGVPAQAGVATLIFLLGGLFAFVLGPHKEVLRGQGRMHVANIIEIVGLLAQAACIWMAAREIWSLPTLTAATIGCTVATMVAMTCYCQGDTATRADPRRFEPSRIRSIMSFSISAYAITTLNVIMASADQLIIASLVGVQALALYLPGLKLGQMFQQLALQFHDTLGPIAARWSGQQRSDDVTALLLQTQPWSCWIAVLIGLPLLVMPEAALRVLTGEAAPASSVVWCAILLLVGHMCSVIASGVPKRILMMTGHHAWLVKVSLIEAGVNVALSLLLVLWLRDPVGVAIGIMVAESLVPLCCVLPGANRRLGLAPWTLHVLTLRRGLLPLAPAVGVAIAVYVARYHGYWHASYAWYAAVAAGLLGTGVLGIWFCGLTPDLRAGLIGYARGLVRHRRAG